MMSSSKSEQLTQGASLDAAFSKFIARFETDARAGLGALADAPELSFNTYMAEAQTAFDLLRNELLSTAVPSRILEVGAGLGIFAHFLAELGHEVVAIEPYGAGFDHFAKATQIIATVREAANQSCAVVLPLHAQELSVETNGTFNLIYSVNVLEHIPELEDALAGTARVLDHDGIILSTCPNYRVPYEPHFSIPLIPCVPWPKSTNWLTRRLFAKTIETDEDLWRSINFITPRRLDHIAKTENLAISYRPHVMAQALERFRDDRTFAARHENSFIGRLIGLGIKLGLIRIARGVPARWATPMIFQMGRSDNAYWETHSEASK